MSRFQVRKVAVLGAGVMGAQIAAHLVNVKVPVVLFDLPAHEGPKNGIVAKAVDGLKKLKPAPLAVADDAALITQANYEEDLALLAGCDLVIEAIAERMDWKLDLYQRVAPFIAPHAIVASNTSGLSITRLAEVLPEEIRPRFCGIHFFNPPRYMALVELIPTPATGPQILDQLETFVTTSLGKGVVRAKDTPNFVANRVGIAGMLATLIEAGKFGLSVDLVDDLTGKKLGRASSGTFRTADVVGLDTMAHVIRTLQDNLRDDPFYDTYATPPVVAMLIEQGALGQKSGAGFYKKAGKDILRLDFTKGDYVPSGAKADPLIDRILKKPPAERLKLLRESTNPQAQFLWSILRDGFHYAAVHLAEIADSAREVDFAMRWGFGFRQGPFELWQEAGWQQVAQWIREDIEAGKALAKVPLPAWVFDGREGVHAPEGSWSASQGRYVPRYVLVSDSARLRLHDLDTGERFEVPLGEFHKHIRLFAFIRGQTPRVYQDAPAVNLKAANLMAQLHDALRDGGYSGHPLEVFLVRLMFCLFADHTGIFENRGDFRAFVEESTREDGSDCGLWLTELFTVLDKHPERRQKHQVEPFAGFPYVNGELFKERFEPPGFDAASRRLLLRCCTFDWSKVSPAVFGSLFQFVMDKAQRKTMGAYYTSEKNILKVVHSLFLDELSAEFSRARTPRELRKLAHRVRAIRVFDPACGCGNFLIVSYRELRKLELDIQKKLLEVEGANGTRLFAAAFVGGLDVDAMYGIEIEEFPARIAETALYLVDHQINTEASVEFGTPIARLPLQRAPHIVHGNALTLDWRQVAPPSEVTYVIGNPPFRGKKTRTEPQNDDMLRVFRGWSSFGELDYVACWYKKAADYVKGTEIRVAFVSTNSITQGEQVALLWAPLFDRGVRIDFAHRTFRWNNDAPGQAHVHCVIIGFHCGPVRNAHLYDYEDPGGEPTEVPAANINPYLVDAGNAFVHARKRPLRSGPLASFGSMPNDEGRLILSDEERQALVAGSPDAQSMVRPFLSAREFLSGEARWCLWLRDVAPSAWSRVPAVRHRVEEVQRYRAGSKRAATRALADKPALFAEDRQPAAEYILIPRHTSENRRYIPIAFCTPIQIAADSCIVVRTADLYHFAVLTSAMHMAWVRHVCGRLKSDYRYSAEIVFNNFPWPRRPSDARVEACREAARGVLETRARFPGESLAALYDPVSMPAALTDAHRRLDRAVDRCYRERKFVSDLERGSFVFEEYARQNAEEELTPAAPRARGKAR